VGEIVTMMTPAPLAIAGVVGANPKNPISIAITGMMMTIGFNL